MKKNTDNNKKPFEYAGEGIGVEGIMRISEGIMRIRNELAVAFILHRTSCFQPTLCAIWGTIAGQVFLEQF